MTYTDTQVAEVCHAAACALQKLFGDEFPSQPWDLETRELRESTLAGVALARRHPGVTPEGLHGAWVLRRQAQGWVHGPDKSFNDKTHPCLVKYEDLPPYQQVKPRVFLAIVAAMS
jgi:RyR domain